MPVVSRRVQRESPMVGHATFKLASSAFSQIDITLGPRTYFTITVRVVPVLVPCQGCTLDRTELAWTLHEVVRHCNDIR
jgi:hypothetical protein